MRRASELTRLDGRGLDEHAPVPEQRGSVAGESLVRIHMRDPCDPKVRRVHPGGPADMGHVERNADGRGIASRCAYLRSEAEGDETRRNDDSRGEDHVDDEKRALHEVRICARPKKVVNSTSDLDLPDPIIYTQICVQPWTANERKATPGRWKIRSPRSSTSPSPWTDRPRSSARRSATCVGSCPCGSSSTSSSSSSRPRRSGVPRPSHSSCSFRSWCSCWRCDPCPARLDGSSC